MALVCASALTGFPHGCGEREVKRATRLDMERIKNRHCFIPILSMARILDTIEILHRVS